MKEKNTHSHKGIFELDEISVLNMFTQQNKEKNLKDKLEMLITLGTKAGYDKLTDKQLVVAYYGRYTTKDHNDCKTLSEIKEGMKRLQSPFKDHIEYDD